MERKDSEDSISQIESISCNIADNSHSVNKKQEKVDTPAFEVPQNLLSSKDMLSRKKGRPCMYEGAEFPELLDKAKLILPSTNYDINKLLEQEEFKQLRNSKDLPRFLSKYVLNKFQQQGSKSVREKSINIPEAPVRAIIDYSNMGEHAYGLIKQQQSVLQPQSQSTPQANYGAKIQSEITSNYLREYMLLKPSDRYQFIEKICMRNSQSLLEFLINLKTTCSSNFCDGMFSLIHELNQNLKLDLQIKTRLFVQSLLYYRDEKILIESNLLKASMTLLAHRPNSEQTLGLANYIFINEIEAFSQLQDELVMLDSKNIGIIPLMIGTFTSFKIDPQVIRLLPNTLQCLTKPFIQILKQDFGLRLIRQIPVEVVGDFVQICALCQSRNYEDLDKMINNFQDIFIQKWDFLDQADFSLLIAQISVELKERNLNWIGKISEIIEIAQKVVVIQLEKGIKNRPDLMLELISGNKSQLKQILKNPRQVDEFSSQQFYKMINKFKKSNKGNVNVDKYCNEVSENIALKCSKLSNLESLLGFKYLTLQKLCLNFYSWSLDKYLFFNVGIGNGKTLLCASIAILASLERKKSSIILGKNDYLLLRDEKRFQNIIIESGLNVNLNQYEQKIGVYYMTQKYFESQQDNQEFLDFLSDSSLIIDEYDWIIFDGSQNQMVQNINYIRKANYIVALTGSHLSQKELTCLKTAFQINEVKFPNLSILKSDKKIHLQDILFSQSQGEYLKFIYEVSMKQTLQTPVIIVASAFYQMIESYFKKFKELQFFSMKNVKGSKIDAYLEEKFNVPNNSKRFGVFLQSEIQGRGTDLHSSREIEQNGGLYLIIGDIFSKTSTSQIIGRVGRLENKGQWRQLIFSGGSQDTIEQAISCKQEFIENENHLKFSRLQTTLINMYGELEPQADQDNRILYSDLSYTFKQPNLNQLNIPKEEVKELIKETILQGDILEEKELQSQIIKENLQLLEEIKDQQQKENGDQKQAGCLNEAKSQTSIIKSVSKKNYTFNDECSDEDKDICIQINKRAQKVQEKSKIKQLNSQLVKEKCSIKSIDKKLNSKQQNIEDHIEQKIQMDNLEHKSSNLLSKRVTRQRQQRINN